MNREHPSLGRSALAVLAALLFAGADAFAGDAFTRYPETIAVLSGVYDGEVRARIGYAACSCQAAREGYPNIAYLFRPSPRPRRSTPSTSAGSSPPWAWRWKSRPRRTASPGRPGRT